MLADARFGPFGKSEQSLAREMLSSIRDASVSVLDRGLIDCALLGAAPGGGFSRLRLEGSGVGAAIA